MLILVSGWRDHPDEHAVYGVLDRHWRGHPHGEPFTVLHGDCETGADAYADHWCVSRGVPVLRRPARDFGVWPWCGPRRNTAMVREARLYPGPKAVVAFPQPDWRTARRCGTRDLITKAERAGLAPEIYPASVPSTKGGQP